MKKLLLGLSLCVTFLTTNVSCQNTAQKEPQTIKTPAKGVTDLNTIDFQKKLNTDNAAIILDVRTPEEFANGHLQNATTINFFGTDFKEKVNNLDKTKPIYVYCAVGGRSVKAAKVLQDAGFKAVYNLLGGFNGWVAAGFPSVK